VFRRSEAGWRECVGDCLLVALLARLLGLALIRQLGLWARGGRVLGCVGAYAGWTRPRSPLAYRAPSNTPSKALGKHLDEMVLLLPR